MKNETLSLLGTTARIETPVIKVTIGDYVFGYYNKSSVSSMDARGVYSLNKITYPNYIQNLTVQKVNGTVNRYTLKMVYAITENDDPNFFEKVFSSISQTRKIIFSYGDLSTPNFCYKDEEAMITDIKNNFSVQDSKITYTISAVSTGKMSSFGTYAFPGKMAKPSDEIMRILYDTRYGLLDVFYGMRDRNLVEMAGLIASNDKVVKIESKTNISVLDYLTYLVNCMTNVLSNDSTIKKSIYSFVVIDEISDKFKGPYFKVVELKKSSQDSYSTAYSIDVGYPSQNVVTAFNVDNDESYSLFYNYTNQLSDSKYVQRINDKGEIEEVFAPTISSGNAQRITTEADKTWWTRVTQYPIKATITFKGLLRPAILMTHVKVNVYFYGRKHISSGVYVVTEQTDNIGFDGFRTTLKLLRVDSEELV